MNVNSLTRRIRKTSAFQEIAGRFCAPLEPEQWIFVVGCYNSGTSLLASLLAKHPDCAGASNEGVALTTKLARPETYGWPRLWIKCRQQMLVSDNGDDARSTAEIIKRQWSPSFSRGKQCIVEKSITNALRIQFLHDHFAPARFVHITRDGVAVAEGIRRKAKPGKFANPEGLEKYPLELCIEQWVQANETIKASLATLPDASVASISYEELCANPQDTLSALFARLGLPTECLENDRSMMSKVSTIANMNARSYESLDKQDIDNLRQLHAEQFKAWGYTSENHE